MMDELVLFDVNNTLVKDSKDVSEYVAESIRNIYGILVDVDLSKYSGLTAQETAEAILKKNGVPQEEIDQKLVRYTEDMYYSYYNVAGHDWQIPLEGARELLEELSKKGVLIGVATGEPEKIARFRLDKTEFSKYFRFGAFGNEARDANGIINKALERAQKEQGFTGSALVVCSSPKFVSAAKASGTKVVGVANSSFSSDDLKSAGADAAIKSLRERAKIFVFL